MYCFPFEEFFTPLYHKICDFSEKKNVNSKILKNLTFWEKTEARFKFSKENYSGNDISHSMNTRVIFY